MAELADSVAVAVASGQRPAGESSRLPKRLAGFAELLLQLADGIHGETGRILDAGGRPHNDLLLSLVNVMGVNATSGTTQTRGVAVCRRLSPLAGASVLARIAV